MNEEKHWNKVAPSYNEDVLNVFASERNKVLPKYFHKHADKNQFAIDFGCGVGNGFDFLSPSFKNILAIDISQACLNIAKRRTFNNISFKRVDLTSQRLRLPRADFGLCCNVAILPDPTQNQLIIKNVYKALKKGGHALIVIPSLDSMIFSAWRIIDLYRRENITPGRIPKSDLDGFKGPITDILRGIVQIEGVRTKHYTASEIEVVFNDLGFKILNIEKLEYDWTTEIATPPRWMKEPYPWDWLIEVRK
jgi:SAM-dependent methyltransferase